ncbi:hypothetical protein RFI_18299 [Reticulomyxa filosa]|uniref:Peptidase C14 caspase domain-containing protein n=1 Tax=Reticulomyxa filosa TaxID=46433 RepID=X6MZ89_RETFI|nr:hypothetical protein RFI_18299 [Reticulomyxa filosa]|eukprot:ETO18943.1 hypothetical protein RFI_18299 [Reticulomyxa filosa]
MSFLEAFVAVESKKYRLELASSKIEHLKQQIIEVSQNDQKGNILTRITTCDGYAIETDEHLQKALEWGQIGFSAYFEPNNEIKALSDTKEDEEKKAKQKEMEPENELKNPLVLLTGAMQYEQQPYLGGVKQDLQLLQTLFQSKFGYQVFSTYDAQNPSTESLTLKELNDFVLGHCAKLAETCNNIDNKAAAYDGLIFVWCGYGSLKKDGATLLTSDHTYKNCKELQDEIIHKTAEYFVMKPKIFIIIGCTGRDTFSLSKIKESCNNAEQTALVCNQDANVLNIIVNVIHETGADDVGDELIGGKTASYFTKVFCRMLQADCKNGIRGVIEQVMGTVHDQLLNGEFVQSVSTCFSDVHLVPRSVGDEMKTEVAPLENRALGIFGF